MGEVGVSPGDRVLHRHDGITATVIEVEKDHLVVELRGGGTVRWRRNARCTELLLEVRRLRGME